MTNSVILNADSISKTYRGTRVLTAASVAVKEKTVVGLLGRMGAGKSTLLRICAGATSPDSGWVEFSGKQYFQPRLFDLARRGLFYLPERNALAHGLTLREHLEAVRRRYGCTDYAEVIELLKLETIIDLSPEKLSGGEERRACFAIAMVRRPTCLIVDEPFRSVDPILGDLLGSCLRRMASQGCAILVTGQEVAVLAPFLDSVFWVTSGTTYDLGTPGEAWKHDRFRREYLGQAALGSRLKP